MKKNTKIKLIVVLFAILMMGLIYIKFEQNKRLEISNTNNMQIFENVVTNKDVKVNKYFIYGKTLNVEGQIEIPKISDISISKVNLVLRDNDGAETSYAVDFTYKDNIAKFFATNINDGINLEKLQVGKYYVFLKVLLSSNEERYYALSNLTEYENAKYYTITKEKSNNYIEVNFENQNDRQYMKIEVSKVEELPEDIYDFVIDPGHGGTDTGAKSDGQNEADIVLECAEILKKKLEDLGYKVILTRDKNYPDDLDTNFNMYDWNGRVTVANESHAKLLISLHLNNSPAKYSSGGVEVYAPSNCNYEFAKALVDNIVDTAQTSYSNFKLYRKEEGVYVHNYSQIEIANAEKSAKKNGYEPYKITTSTPYMYILREIGGIATNAFVDGRNRFYSANKYFNSNVGIEGYSIDLGYMYIKKDLNNVIKNKNLYMKAIADCISKKY